jgi:rhamnogalacturonan endolyase
VLLAASLATPHPALAQQDAPVTVTDDGRNFILSNGYLTATINKNTGDMTSLKVKGIETQGYVSGHHAGYWEQSPSGAARLESKLTIDPATNGGARAEVSIKGWSDGKSLTGQVRRPGDEFPRPAGATAAATAGEDTPEGGEAPVGSAPVGPAPPLPPGVQRNRGTATGRRPGGGGPGLLVDMEIRYTLGRGEHGIYTYAIYTHQPSHSDRREPLWHEAQRQPLRLALHRSAAQHGHAHRLRLGPRHRPQHEGGPPPHYRRQEGNCRA